MQQGPSKEELREYWKNSRQYFDELAKSYRESDPKYYEEYIAPFYRNPLYAMGGKQGKSGRSVAVIAVFILAIGAGAVFFLMQKETSRNKKIIPPAPFKGGTESAKDTASTSSESDYATGVKYFNDENYENAEKYLRRVKYSDKNYSDARKKINEIVKIKKKKMEKELKKQHTN